MNSALSWAELSQIEWRAPLAWLVLLLPLITHFIARSRQPAWQAYAEPHLQAWAVQTPAIMPSLPRNRLWNALFYVLLACALAGPRLPINTQSGTRAQHDIDIMVVLDVSASMAATDVPPNRLQRAKLKLQDLIARLHGERLGLIVYAGEAGLLAPLSHDLAAFQDLANLADETLFDEAGSNLAAALGIALKSFARAETADSTNAPPAKRARAVLLLSDAEASSLSGAAGPAAISAARALGAAHIPLYVLALNSESGAAIPLKDGGQVFQQGATVMSVADLPGYRSLTALSGGALAVVQNDDGDWNQLYDRGLLGVRATRDASDPSLAWRELFAYPLAAALLLLLLRGLSINRGTTLLAAALASSGARADDAQWRAAYQAYGHAQYLSAQQQYAELSGFEARMGEGAAAYKRHDYNYAREQFTRALLRAGTPQQSADALFNLGNSYFFGGNLIAAADAFSEVLRLRPQDGRARKNLTYTQAQLARRAAGVRQAEGIPGRRGRGVGDAPFDAESPLGMAPDKDEKRPLLALQAPDATEARRLGNTANVTVGKQEAHQRAALKQLDLLKDQRLAVSKQLLKQDAERAPPADMPPW